VFVVRVVGCLSIVCLCRCACDIVEARGILEGSASLLEITSLLSFGFFLFSFYYKDFSKDSGLAELD
jgi:hypothetical protein